MGEKKHEYLNIGKKVTVLGECSLFYVFLRVVESLFFLFWYVVFPRKKRFQQSTATALLASAFPVDSQPAAVEKGREFLGS